MKRFWGLRTDLVKNKREDEPERGSYRVGID